MRWLSGFLIQKLASRQPWGLFLARRWLRLAPALYTYVAVAVLASNGFHWPHRYDGKRPMLHASHHFPVVRWWTPIVFLYNVVPSDVVGARGLWL